MLIDEVKSAFQRGWALTPLHGKKAFLTDWTTLPKPTLPEVVSWARKGNVGLRTGAVSGIFVIDVDPGADPSFSERLPPTPTVRTGRDGRHYYFKAPTPCPGNSAGRIPHVDTRGEGGQVVYPGSKHPETGKLYEWLVSPDDCPLAEVPAWVLELLNPPPAPRPTARPMKAYARAALDQEIGRVAQSTAGARNDTLVRAAFSLGQLVGGGQLSDDLVRSELQTIAQRVGLPEREAARTIQSGMLAGIAQPRKPPGRPASKPQPSRPAPEPTDSTKPEILIPGPFCTDDGEYGEVGAHEFVRAVLTALPPGAAYVRSDIIGEVSGLPGKRQFRIITARRMQAIVDTHVRLIRWSAPRKGDPAKLYVSCTRELAELILGSALHADILKPLTNLVNYPVYLPPDFRPAPTGYDEPSGVYYDQPPALADLPLQRDERIIRDTLYDLIVDFPFDSDSSRQNFFGLLLTPLLRPALKGNVPLHLIDSSIERAGKGKLIDQVLGRIITGEPIAGQQYKDDENESDKMILSCLLSGGSIIHLDNLNSYVNSAALASLITAARYRGRVLGQSATATIENTFTITGTGNNVKLSSELVKRTIPIILRPQTDNPQSRRDFKHPNLETHLDTQRPIVLGCLLGMIENWRAAGSIPLDEMPFGGFEAWAGTIGGVLWFVGLTEWRKSSSGWTAYSDTDGEDLRVLVTAWAEQTSPICSTSELFQMAEELDVFSSIRSGKSREGSVVRFGIRVLRRFENRPVSGYKITRYEGIHRGKWILSQL